MLDLLKTQCDYLLFAHGLAMIVLASKCLCMRLAPKDRLPWGWLACFGVLQGLNVWLEMLAVSLGDSAGFKWVRLLFLAAAFVSLVWCGWCVIRAQQHSATEPWVLVPLLALAGLGGAAGFDGLNVTVRYALALPGGLLAGLAFVREARQADRERRRPLSLAGAAFFVYGLFSGLVVPKATFFPASVLNDSSFMARTGVPVQLLCAMCAAVIAAGVWAIASRKHEEEAGRPYVLKWWVPATFAALVIGGFGLTEWRGKIADTQQRNHVLSQASAIARTINTERIRALSFSPADKDNPHFRRLEDQLRLYARTAGHRSIYSQAIRNGQIVFGPESLLESDPMASPPGTVYQRPPEALREAFRSCTPQTVGPYSDEYGTFVSAFAPILAPRSNEVILVIGIDIEARTWQAIVARERLNGILFTLALAVVFVGARALVYWRGLLPMHQQGILRHAETLIVGSTGLTISLMAAHFAHDQETRSRQLIFSHLADRPSSMVVTSICDIRDDLLGNLGRFFESHRTLDQRTFNQYAKGLRESGTVEAWAWVPVVKAPDRTLFEEAARQEGLAHFQIWEKDAQGRQVRADRRNVYYPVRLMEPVTGNEGAFGYDLGSDAIRRAALEEVIRTGLPTGTEPAVLIQDAAHQKSIFAYHPVLDQEDPSHLRGFAVAALRTQSLLSHCLGKPLPGQSTTIVEWYQLRSNQPPFLLARSPEGDAPAAVAGIASHGGQASLSLQAPLLILGKAYVIVVRPGQAFLAAHPERAFWLTLAVGVFLTIVLASSVGLFSQHRTLLEQQVKDRTAELLQSESKFHTLFEDSKDAYFLIADGVVRDCNKALLSLFQADREQIIGRSPDEFSPELQPNGVTSKESALEKIEDALTAGGARFEWVHRRVGGTDFWAEVVLTALPLDGGVQLFASMRDITDRKQAEHAASIQAMRNQVLLQTGSDGIHVLDEDGNVVEASDAFCRMLGYKKEDLLRMNVADWEIQWSSDELRAKIRQLIRSPEVFETRHRSKDGRIRDVEISARGVNLDGHLYLYASARDITERKQTEETLRCERQRLADIIEGTRVGTWEWMVQTGETTFNERWADIVGYTLDELQPVSIQTWLNLVHPDDAKVSEELIRRHFAGEIDHYDCECRMKHKDGSWIWVHDRGKVVDWADDGTPLRMTGTHSDITHRKRAEEELRESEERFRKILHSLQVGIVLVDAQNHRIIDANPKAAVMTGCRQSDLIGVECHELICPAERGRCPVTDLGQSVDASERTLLTVGGEKIPVLKTVLPARIGGRDTLVESFVDIEKMKEVEVQLAAAKTAAEEASRLKSDFLANMSHEIRTPMTAVLGYSDVISECCPGTCDYGNGELKSAISIIRRSGHHLLGLINDILDLSKIEAGQMSVELLACSTYDILAEVASIASVRAKSKGLEFDIESIGPIPRSFRTDPMRLRQILINLIGNAVKFTESGGVRLVTRLVEGDGEPYMQFDVIDTGIGMTDEQAARIFKPFSQADVSTARQFGGTGLGLVISKRLAHLLGGDLILADSKPGLGTRFRVTVATGPLDGIGKTESWDPRDSTSASRCDKTPLPSSGASTLRDVRILLAEDGPDNQRLIAHVLKKAGATVELAENGRVAVSKALAAAAEKAPFDVILMDMQMPEVDGYEATGILRARGYTRPIIALTAHAMATERKKCLEAGCDDFATKPIERACLIRTILAHVPGKPQAESSCSIAT